MLTLVIENKQCLMAVSQIVTDRSLVRPSFLYQSFKVDGAVSSVIVESPDR